VFEGFETDQVEVDGVAIHVRTGGNGPPVLLLHGYPQTGAMWHEVAPALAETHTVVVPDLRGYGASAKPPSQPDHASYGKRAMAADQAGLMRRLGHMSYAVVGHDRGGRVAHRLALDHREEVARAAVLDIVPTRHVFGHVDKTMALAYYHWFFLAQEDDLPEVLIGSDPELYLRRKLGHWSAPGAVFDDEAVAEYLRCFSDPETIRATTEDYRAGATIDLEHDEATWLGGDQLACPLLALWGEEGFVGSRYDVLSVWRDYVERPDLVTGHAVPGGHFVAEEAPAETVEALSAFLG
jgi:haloacetate dehalogenase